MHRDDAGGLPARLPAGRGQPARLPIPARRKSRAAWASAGCAPSSGSRSARPGAPSSAAACSWRWCCSPSTARSRCSATGPSLRRSSPTSSCRPRCRSRARCRWCWSPSACSCSAGEGWLRGRGRVARSGPMAQRGHAAAAAAAGCQGGRAGGHVPAAAAPRSGMPLGASIYWIVARRRPVGVGLGQRLHAERRAAHGRLRPAARPLIDTLLALPVAVLAIRHTGAAPAFPGAQHLPGAGACRAS